VGLTIAVLNIPILFSLGMIGVVTWILSALGSSPDRGWG
jgi:putative Mn2+ efflux pump MntP